LTTGATTFVNTIGSVSPGGNVTIAGAVFGTIGTCTMDSQCNDNDPCNGLETCVSAQCQPGTRASAPSEVGTISASKSAVTVTFDWSGSVGATRYDMLRGRVREWPVGSNPLTEACFDDLIATTANDATAPPVDDGYWYLVRGENACGNGDYGFAGSHGVPTAPRLSATCP